MTRILTILCALTALPFVAAFQAEPPTKDLLGHWKLDDEKTSTTAVDVSGHGLTGKLVKDPVWTVGKVGGALQFDGKEGHVELPRSEKMDKLQEGSYTISAWFKPDNLPPGADTANDAYYGIVIKNGCHEGLRFNYEGKFAMDHWLLGENGEEDHQASPESGNSFEPGKFYHLMGIVDREAGKTFLYVNGEREGTATWKAGATARDYGEATWKIGIAEPGAEEWGWSAKGIIDDVRLYGRALTADEVKSLRDAADKK
jgi:concanavalin A-like lectin/glucanase superfamily protein